MGTRRRLTPEYRRDVASLLLDTGSSIASLAMGFCAIRSLPTACRRRVAALMVQFPPCGGGEVTVRGGVAPKVQTTSATNADNGVSWARWSTLWAKLSRTWCVARTRTRYCVRSPAISHVNPLFHVWAGLPTLTLAGPRAHERAQARGEERR